MSAKMPWFRMYTDFLNDPKMIALAFEDQRHFIGILALKSDDALDAVVEESLMDRIVAQRLWIDPAAISDVKAALIDAGRRFKSRFVFGGRMTPATLAPADLRNVKCNGIICASLQKDNGLDGLDSRRKCRAHSNMLRGLFHGEHESNTTATAPFLVGRAGAPQGAIVPTAIPSIPHGLPPTHDGSGGRFIACSVGAIMAISLDARARQSSRFHSLDLDDLLQGQDTAHAEVDRLAKELAMAAAPLAGHGDGNCGVVIRAILEALTAQGLYIDPKTRPKTPPKKQIISQGLRTKVLERDAYRCVQCATHVDLSVDHIKPESKGGTLAFDNLQTLCRPCNSSKGAKE